MVNATLFLFYQENPLFFRSLHSLEKWISKLHSNNSFEILIFYRQSLPIEKLKKKFPHTRWWRIPTMYHQNYWLLNKAMSMSQYRFFFFVDGKAKYAKTDFINMINFSKQEGLVCVRPQKFLPLDKGRFYNDIQRMRNQIYASLNNSASIENFRLVGLDKNFMQDFFLSLTPKEQFVLLRQKIFDKNDNLAFPFMFLHLFEKKFQKSPFILKHPASHFSISPLPFFSFYYRFFALLSLSHKTKYSGFIHSNWFVVPVIHLSFILLIAFYFSLLMTVTALLFIIFFSFFWLPPNLLKKIKQYRTKNLIKILLLPFQKIIAIVFL